MKRKSIVFLIALVLILSGCQSGKQHVKKRKKEHKHQNKIENKYDKRHHKDEKNLVEYDGKVSHVFFILSSRIHRKLIRIINNKQKGIMIGWLQ